ALRPPTSTLFPYTTLFRSSLRNAGRGIAVVHGWRFYGNWEADRPEPALDEFHRQGRDLYLPPGEVGFWQAAFRDQNDPQYEEARSEEHTSELQSLAYLVCR